MGINSNSPNCKTAEIIYFIKLRCSKLSYFFILKANKKFNLSCIIITDFQKFQNTLNQAKKFFVEERTLRIFKIEPA